MRRRRTSTVCALAAALVGAGCGAGQEDSAERFGGEEQRVATVVDELRSAAESGDAAEVCSRLLSRALVERVEAPGSNCSAEIDDALGDADDFDLDVREVQVAGDRATARVRDGEDRLRTLAFARENGDWRVSAFATS